MIILMRFSLLIYWYLTSVRK